jgi:hypothetical protein
MKRMALRDCVTGPPTSLFAITVSPVAVNHAIRRRATRFWVRLPTRGAGGFDPGEAPSHYEQGSSGSASAPPPRSSSARMFRVMHTRLPAARRNQGAHRRLGDRGTVKEAARGLPDGSAAFASSISCRICRRNRATINCTTSWSAAASRRGSGVGVGSPNLCSTPFIRSITASGA